MSADVPPDHDGVTTDDLADAVYGHLADALDESGRPFATTAEVAAAGPVTDADPELVRLGLAYLTAEGSVAHATVGDEDVWWFPDLVTTPLEADDPGTAAREVVRAVSDRLAFDTTGEDGGDGTARGLPAADLPWETVRRLTFDAEGDECQFCGVSREAHREEYGRDLIAHHVFPEGRGGRDHPANAITVCLRHHQPIERMHAQAMVELARLAAVADA